MERPVVVDDAVPLGRKRPLERERGVESLTVLVEIDDPQPLGALDGPGRGRHLPDDRP